MPTQYLKTALSTQKIENTDSSLANSDSGSDCIQPTQLHAPGISVTSVTSFKISTFN